MTSLERIVRPFQSKDVAPPSRVLDTTVAAPDNVRITCGATGYTRTFNASYSCTTTLYVDNGAREVNRQTTTKRITNPDDSSQYVDVEVIDQIDSSGVNGQKTSTYYINNDS
jgi:hypothetical protein